jgi:hypothetical protein
LQHQIQVEPLLQLADHNHRHAVAAKSDEVATADLTLDVEPRASRKRFTGR